MFSLLNSYQNKVDGYEQWASRSRNWVVDKVRTRSADQVRSLEAASKAAFEANNRNFDIMDERLQRVESGYQRLEDGVQSILNLLQTLQAAAPAAPAAAANDVAPAAGAPVATGGKSCFVCLVALLLSY